MAGRVTGLGRGAGDGAWSSGEVGADGAFPDTEVDGAAGAGADAEADTEDDTEGALRGAAPVGADG